LSASAAPLQVSTLAELLRGRGYRITVCLADVLVAERGVLGVKRAMRRVVGQRNEDGSMRLAYLVARPGPLGGPIYSHELVARDSACRNLVDFAFWIAKQDAQRFPAEATTA